MKTLFIYNPNAGKMQIKNNLYDILNVFAAADYDLTVVPTKASKDATIYLKKHTNEFALIVCSGGDGTLNEVVSGMLASEVANLPPLGYIPAGSTNDYANSLGLPKNMKKAAELITSGNIKAYDMGKFNDKYFVYVAAFGIFTSVAYATPQDTKNVLGHLAYLIEGVKSISDIQAHHLKIAYEDITIEGDFIYGMITNTYSVGGLYKLDKKQVKLDDGQFEVMLVRLPKSPIDLAEINAFVLDSHNKTDMVLTFNTSQITIETNDEMTWTLDGEYGGNPKKVEIKVINKAINIISK